MESKEDKFNRLDNARVNNAIKQLDLIGNLSNSSSYNYSDNEINKEFIDTIYREKIISTKEYNEITGEGWFDLEEDMDYVEELLLGKK